MRLPTNASLILALLAVSIALPAYALQIQICSPSCAVDQTPVTLVSDPTTQTSVDSNGVWTTKVPIATFVFRQFTITATVTAQQSGSLQRISFNPTTIQANAGTGCSVTAPCQLEVMATSDELDFPILKPVGGYPAGSFMSGSFFGTQAFSPNGDTISVTGEASGVLLVPSTDPNNPRPTVVPLNTDIINATPGTGPGNIGTSLPSSCTGTLGCKYIATSLNKVFSTQITDTVQQVCDTGVDSCLTRLRTHLNVAIKTSGNKVSLPAGYATTNADRNHPEINPTEKLVSESLPLLSGLDIGGLAVGRNLFSLTARMQVDPDSNFDPSTQEVYMRVGDLSVFIVPGEFKNLAKGRLFKFVGKVDGREVQLTFSRQTDDSTVWAVVAGVHQIQLTGVAQPPLQTPVEIGVGTTIGRDLVTATFF